MRLNPAVHGIRRAQAVPGLTEIQTVNDCAWRSIYTSIYTYIYIYWQ